MPLPTHFKILLEVVLTDIVQDGREEMSWDKLKPRLATYGLESVVLDAYRGNILDMFLELLKAADNKHSRSLSNPAQD
jgi:hypothetical protein